MAGIFSLLGIDDSTRKFVEQVGQQAVWEAANEYFSMHSKDLDFAISAFVDSDTEDYKERYYLPGGGFMQQRGNGATVAVSKATGSWDVAYPINDFGAAYGMTDVDYGYMTVQDLNRQLQNITIQDTNTVFRELMKAVWGTASYSYIDPKNGSLTIERLANGDSVVYPPVIGSNSEATDSHYLAHGGTAITNTANPYKTIRNELEEHFGTPQGYGNITVFIHPDQIDDTKALSDFTPVEETNVQYGDDDDRVVGTLPQVPGRVVGRCSGVWVVEWRRVPTGYMFGIDPDAPKPMKRRVDPAYTGIGRGLTLVSSNDKYPWRGAEYRNRYGFGVANRLNGVAMKINTTYTIPTDYA